MNKKPSKEKYAAQAKKLGARDAKLIATRSVVTAHWVRLKCQYGCSGYGQALTCPPHSPTPDQTAAVLKEFRSALLIHGDGNADIRDMAVGIERQAFLDGYYKAWAMCCGPCEGCADCALKPGACRHPETARPAMEACGIDVYQTVRNNGLPIEVVRETSDPQNYYALVLLE